MLLLASENNADPETLLLPCIPNQIPEFQAQLPDGPQPSLPSVPTLNSSQSGICFSSYRGVRARWFQGIVFVLFCPLMISLTSYEHRKGGIISSSKYFVLREHLRIPSKPNCWEQKSQRLLQTEVPCCSNPVPHLPRVMDFSRHEMNCASGVPTLSDLIRNQMLCF